MTTIEISVDGIEKNLYIDNLLNRQLDKKVIPNVKKKDNDGVYVVDGLERSGKSVFSMQLAMKLDPDFCLDRICFTPEEFTKKIITAKKGQCVVFDEAFTGLSSRGSLTEINRLLVSLMMEMGQKNLFVIIVMPTFFLLDKYVALWRARGLFHVYTKRGKRGYWMFFNKNTKKLLYLKGKKLYDYSEPKSNFRGMFFDLYTVNEEQYRKKKGEAMSKKSRATRALIFKSQRDVLFYIISKKFKQNNTQIAMLCSEYGFRIARKTISDIIIDKNKDFLEEKMIQELKLEESGQNSLEKEDI